MTGAIARKELDTKLVLDEVGTRSAGLRRKGTNCLMIMNVVRKILMRICIDGFICYGGQLEINSAVNR